MTTFGKIAGGGFQLAGFGGESQIMETLEPGRGWRNATFHAGTYNGHPIGVAAGLKAVQILGEHPEYYDHVNRLGRQLFSGLQDLADDRRIPAWVEYVGSIGNVYFTTKDEIRNFRDTLSANTRRWWNWFIHCLGNNVLFGIPNTGERAFLSTEHTDEDIEWALEVADGAFAAIAKEARRNREKAPSVQLQAAGEQASPLRRDASAERLKPLNSTFGSLRQSRRRGCHVREPTALGNKPSARRRFPEAPRPDLWFGL